MTKNNIGKYIEVEQNLEMYYESMGSGDPIIFIPGWTFTTELFEHQMQHFSKTHQAITYV